MLRIAPALQHYDWGSTDALPDLLNVPGGQPVAEAWFGAHASAPSVVDGGAGLDALIAADPAAALGQDVVVRFGPQLPYLLKVIAAVQPLSLQVHPTRSRAAEGYAREDAAGVPVESAIRNYRDLNHKPEMAYALTRLEAMVGFRAPRRAAELLVGLDSPLAAGLRERLVERPDAHGMRAAFEWLMAPDTRPGADALAEFAVACASRVHAGSPSPRTDRTVIRLHALYPDDPGAVTSVLLNPVTLRPGEALFIPAGAVHAYLEGTAVEIMANSDNVLRAGLTSKHVDLPELLDNLDSVAAPPIRIAPEHVFTHTDVFYAPVDDFELSVTTLLRDSPTRVPGRGPRILLCLEGNVRVCDAQGVELELARGQSAFVPAGDGALTASGDGTLIQADVP